MRQKVLFVVSLLVLMPTWASKTAFAVCYETSVLDCVNLADPTLGKELVWSGTTGDRFWFQHVNCSSCEVSGDMSGVDAAGNLYTLGVSDFVFRTAPFGQREVFATIANGTFQNLLGKKSGIAVDVVNGRVYLALHDGGPSPQFWVVAITGLPALFDVLQGYEPTANRLSIRVPAHPEGFRAATTFDTYYGLLINPIDFTQARPLECGYPASPPTVGDYLTIADPLPDPLVNTGRYYVTVANYMGQRRYGRQNVGGVLSGRNPANLPHCEQTEE